MCTFITFWLIVTGLYLLFTLDAWSAKRHYYRNVRRRK